MTTPPDGAPEVPFAPPSSLPPPLLSPPLLSAASPSTLLQPPTLARADPPFTVLPPPTLAPADSPFESLPPPALPPPHSPAELVPPAALPSRELPPLALPTGLRSPPALPPAVSSSESLSPHSLPPPAVLSPPSLAAAPSPGWAAPSPHRQLASPDPEVGAAGAPSTMPGAGDPERGRRRRIAVAAVALLAVVAVAAAVVVPRLGDDASADDASAGDDASAVADERAASRADDATSSSDPAATVVETASAPTATEPPETTAAPRREPLPDVVGMSLAVANQTLVGPTTVEEVVATEPWMIDIVTSQTPAAGTPVLPDDPILITVGVRPEPELVAGETLPDEFAWLDLGTLQVGDCARWRLADGLVLDQVPCDLPHRFELIAEITVADLGPFDEDLIYADIDAQCNDAFERYVLSRYEDSAMYMRYVLPYEELWPGDRTAWCLLEVGAASNDVVGSAAGSMW